MAQIPMPSLPLVSVVIAAGDDNAAFDRSLRSCLAQSLAQIEIVCVFSAVTSPVAADMDADRRIALVIQPTGASPAQLRRAGVEAANAPFVLVLEPGDELNRRATTRLLRRAEETQAQLVGFAVAEPAASGETPISPPAAQPLHGADILRSLAPRDTAVGLEIRRALFRTELLRQAYAAASTGTGPLVDDRAVVLFAYASAASYSSVSTVEYHRRSVGAKTSAEAIRFGRALERIRAFRGIEPTIRERAYFSADPEPLLEGYTAGYLTLVAEALTLFDTLPSEQCAQEYVRLRECVGELDIVSAAVTLAPETIPTIIAHGTRSELGRAPVRSALLTTNVLTTGGVSGVLLTQARFLIDAGYRVTIATHRPGSAESLVPEGATLVQLTGTTRRQRVAQWAQLCRRNEVGVVIDHRILYSRDWPAYALAARATGAATVGWIHNFAGRPTYNGNDLQTVLRTHLGALAHLVVLSPLDVAFWKLRGIPHVSYLPNPPSPFLMGTGEAPAPKHAPQGRRLELVWWGRLEEHTKKVSQLVEVAAALQRLGVDFRLRIVGPDWADTTAESLLALATKRSVVDRVELTGPQHGADLLELIDSSDVFVNTSIIEGYPLTLPEAQSRGLPVVMYDLPWLSLVQGNAGVITASQQDPDALAIAIADLAADPERYKATSRASIAAAADATSHDFAQLYEQLLHGRLPPEHSPEPTLEDGRKMLELLVFFAERSTPPPRAGAGRAATPGLPESHRRARSGTFGQRIERKLTPIGRRVVDGVPWLRPAASNVKRVLLRR